MWRIDGERFTHTWEDRFAIQEGYTPNLIAAVRGLLEKRGRSAEDFAKVALYAPDERSARRRAARARLQGPSRCRTRSSAGSATPARRSR